MEVPSRPRSIHPSLTILLMGVIVTTMAPIKIEELPKDEKKIGLKAFVTLDPVAAGKRQEANSRSKIPPWGKKKRRDWAFL
jgi:hypothetical protein